MVKDQTQGLDYTKITAEAKYFINTTRSSEIFCLSLYYNGTNSILYANGVNIYQFKAKQKSISNSVVDYNTIDVRDIIDIHKYFKKKNMT